MHRPGVELAIFRSLVRRPTTTLQSQPGIRKALQAPKSLDEKVSCYSHTTWCYTSSKNNRPPPSCQLFLDFIRAEGQLFHVELKPHDSPDKYNSGAVSSLPPAQRSVARVVLLSAVPVCYYACLSVCLFLNRIA